MRPFLALLLLAAIARPALAEDLETVAGRVKITPAQAIRIAQGNRPARIEELELISLEDRPVYAIAFDDDRKVRIDAISGQILPATRKEAK